MEYSVQNSFEEINKINQAFITMQNALRDRMLSIADIFFKLSEEFEFIDEFKITGTLWISKYDPRIFCSPNKEKVTISEQEKIIIEKWKKITLNNYWRLEYDSSIKDFLPLSKDMLMLHNYYTAQTDTDLNLCSFLQFLIAQNDNICCTDLQDINFDTDHFASEIKAYINYDDEDIYNVKNAKQIELDRKMLIERRNIHNSDFSWSHDNIKRFFGLNEIIRRKFNFMRTELQKLQDWLYPYADEGVIQDFVIWTSIHYKNTQRTDDILDEQVLQMIKRCLRDDCEETLAMDFLNKPMRGCQTEDISLAWNYEKYSKYLSEEEKNFKFSPYMRRDLIDGNIFSFEDIVRMQEKDFCIRWEFCFIEDL